jgi:5-methylcytosine-specific restriction endonuclease McrA
MIPLTKNNANAITHFNRIKDRFLERIPRILRNGIVKNKKKYLAGPTVKPFLEMLVDEQELEKLITLEPEEIPVLIDMLRHSNPGFSRSGTAANLILQNLFIDSVYDDSDVFDKHAFLAMTNLDTCCYCNRNYTYSLGKDSLVKPEIDHFYPKRKYPFLAVSFYNLIPSCQNCNGIGGKVECDPGEKKLVNPYLLNGTEFVFSYDIKKASIVHSTLDKDSIEFVFTKKLDGHLEVFKLQELYDRHRDHIVELILKTNLKYPASYRKQLEHYTTKGLNLTPGEIDRMILGNYADINDLHKRPLAKLYYDIGKELGLIK